MANLRVSDRDLLVDEILNQLEKSLPSREDRLKDAIKAEGIQKDLDKIEKVNEELKTLEKQKEKLEKQEKNLLEELGKKIGHQDKYTWRSPSISEIKNHILSKSEKALPTRKQLETAILLAQGGDDMNALMVSIIEQFKNK